MEAKRRNGSRARRKASWTRAAPRYSTAPFVPGPSAAYKPCSYGNARRDIWLRPDRRSRSSVWPSRDISASQCPSHGWRRARPPLMLGWRHDRRRPDPRQAGRALRPPARALLPVRDRDVGALLLLRHARAARALHGEVPVRARACRHRDRARGAQTRARDPLRAARHPAARLADLRPLYRARLSDADIRRASGRPRARPPPHRRDRPGPGCARPLSFGLRVAVAVRAPDAD